MAEQTPPKFTKVGKKTAEVPVEITYRILELFSGGLYSSPTKAIEELVANAYDAMATNVNVIVSPNLDSPDATVVVIDDGESMDGEGLGILWKIGYSPKRGKDEKAKGRLPIGKFGIGKLATWVLARELTHVCKRGNQYLAVTMFYERIDQKKATEHSNLNLDVRELTETEAKDALAFLEDRDVTHKQIALFGKRASPTWTVAILSNLKPMVSDLKIGRLRWVLSTAMPLTPDFQCYLNGEEVEPSKLDVQPLNTWVIGKDDKVAIDQKLRTFAEPSLDGKNYGVVLNSLGRITGYAAVYEDSLKSGKSEEWGRSHGFFIMVRRRLINLHDPLFGNTPLSHKTFNRFRMVVNCDELDEFLLSSRENVAEKEGTDELRSYLRSKFYEAASWYEDWITKKENERRLATRLGHVPRGLMRRPLVDLVLKALEGKTPLPRLTRIPTGLTKEEKTTFIKKVEGYLKPQEDFIRDVVFESLGIDQPIAIFDASADRLVINNLHPFYRNYEDYFRNAEPFQILGIAEVLTEAYLLEMGMRPEDVVDLLARRDDFLRELVYTGRLSAPLVADMLRDAGGDPKGLEKAVSAAFTSLGFDVTPLGKSGEPDGIARARMGVRSGTNQSKASYTIAYDAKSTKGDRVQTVNVNMAGIDRHRRDYNADFAVAVAKKFADTKEDEAAVVNEARRLSVTLIQTSDLATLVETAATKRLGYQRLRELFESCHSPTESREWIQRFFEERVVTPPIREILYAIYDLQTKQRDEIEIADIRWQSDALKSLDKKDIADWLRAIAALVPEYISVQGDIVDLQMHPDKVLAAIGMNLRKTPASAQRDAFLESLGDALS